MLQVQVQYCDIWQLTLLNESTQKHSKVQPSLAQALQPDPAVTGTTENTQ